MTELKSSTKQISNINTFNFQTLKYLLTYKEKNLKSRWTLWNEKERTWGHGVLMTITKSSLNTRFQLKLHAASSWQPSVKQMTHLWPLTRQQYQQKTSVCILCCPGLQQLCLGLLACLLCITRDDLLCSGFSPGSSSFSTNVLLSIKLWSFFMNYFSVWCVRDSIQFLTLGIILVCLKFSIWNWNKWIYSLNFPYFYRNLILFISVTASL